MEGTTYLQVRQISTFPIKKNNRTSKAVSSFEGKNTTQKTVGDNADIRNEKKESWGRRLLGLLSVGKNNTEKYEHRFVLNSAYEKTKQEEKTAPLTQEESKPSVVDEQKIKIDRLSADNEKFKTETKELKSQLDVLNAEIINLKKKLEEKNKRIEKQIEEVENLKQQLAAYENEAKNKKISEIINSLEKSAEAKAIEENLKKSSNQPPVVETAEETEPNKPKNETQIKETTKKRAVSKKTNKKADKQQDSVNNVIETKKTNQETAGKVVEPPKTTPLDMIYEERQKHRGMFPIDIVGNGCFRYRNKYDSVRDEFVQKDRMKALKELHANEDKDFVKYFHSVPLYYFGSGLPIHYCNAKEMEEIHRFFADEPDVLIKLHFTNVENHNCYGLPFHNLIYKDPQNAVKVIHKLFKDRPDVLEKLHTTEGFVGWYPAQLPKCNLYDVNETFRNNPEILEKIYRKKDNLGITAVGNHSNSLDAVIDAFPNKLDLVEELLLAPDHYGQLPILHTSTPESMKKILETFQHKPDVIEKLLTTQSRTGYAYFHWQPIASEQGKTVFAAIKNNPDLIVKILLLKDNDGKYPIQHAQKKWRPIEREIHGGDFSDRFTREETFAVIEEALKKHPEHLKKVMDVYRYIDYDRYQR